MASAYVKLLTGRVGDRFSQHPGEIIEVGGSEAKRMIAGGLAVPATQQECKESATQTHGENRS